MFPIYVEQFFLKNYSKERGSKVVLCKKPCWRQGARVFEFSLVYFNMFRVDNDHKNVVFQTPISIPKPIQIFTIIGSATFRLTNLVYVVINGSDENNVDPHSLINDVGIKQL
jgi:hypothetical protein